MEDKYKQYQKKKSVQESHEHAKEQFPLKKKKWVQPELPFYGSPEINDHHPRSKEEYYSQVSWKSRTLTEQEVNDLFWDQLLDLGWRLNEDNGFKQIVFACPKCNLIIDSKPYQKITDRDVLQMLNKKALRATKVIHKNQPCKAIPEGADDESM